MPRNLTFFKRDETPICQRIFSGQNQIGTEDFECEIETYHEDEDLEEEAHLENDEEDEESDDEEDLLELVSIDSLRIKSLCNPNHVCISGSYLLF